MNCPVQTVGGADQGTSNWGTPDFIMNKDTQHSFSGNMDNTYTKFTLTPK